MKFELHQRQRQAQLMALSLEAKEALRKEWNETLRDKFAFTPHDKREGLTPERSIEQNERLGASAAGYLQKTIRRRTTSGDVERRLKKGKLVVPVGFGLGYDKDFLLTAAIAGLGTWWIDVSDIACRIAIDYVNEAWIQICSTTPNRQLIPAPPAVTCDAIQSVLADPQSIGLDPTRIEIWYFSRLLGCLSEDTAGAVLTEIGSQSMTSQADPECRHAIVIVNALRDYNPDVQSKKSHLWTKALILQHVSEGAGRSMKIEEEEQYPFFNKTVSALTIRAAAQ